MNAIQIQAPGVLRLIEREKPALQGMEDVLVRMTAAGICGSDVGIYHGTNAAATYPRVIGHEMVGVVEAILPHVTRVKPGDRVIIDQVTSCGACYACRKGRPNVCHHLRVRGVHLDGGYQEYIAVPQRDCYLLPSGLSDADAVLIEPATIALQCCSRAAVEPEDMILLIGAGSLGSSMLRVLRQYHPQRILVADVDADKAETAMALGADRFIHTSSEDLQAVCREETAGYGPTLVIDAACARGTLHEAVTVAGNAGRVMIMGLSVAPEDVDPFSITSKELDIRGSRLQSGKFQQAIDWVSAGKLNLTGGVSHTFPFLEAQKAFDQIDAKDPPIRKAVLLFQQ